MKSLFAVLVAVVFVAGCSLVPGGVVDALEVGVHGKLLDEEFEAASVAVTETPELNDRERMVLWGVIDKLDDERQYLRNILDKPPAEQVVAAVTACQKIQGIAKSYTAGKTVYVSAIAREGGEAPLMLVQYDQSAELVYGGLKAQVCDEGSPIQAADVAGYLGLALRVIAATQGVPV